VSLFFSSIAKIKPVKVHHAGILCICCLTFFNVILILCICQVLILKTCRMNNVVGSGASHAILRNSWHNQHWPTEVGKCVSSVVLVLVWLYGFMQ
jgi:hypothetical protein